MKDYRKLYSFLPYFEEAASKGTEDLVKDGSLFYTEYSGKIDEFVDCFYEQDFMDTSYIETLNQHGIINEQTMAEKIPEADMELLKAIMTQMTREERFTTGAIAGYAKDGLVAQALIRLGEIFDYQ